VPSGERAALATVLVLGTTQRAGQATARSLARAGYRVVGARGRTRLAGRTRYCNGSLVVPSPDDAVSFNPALREICERERVHAIVPLSDEALAALLVRPDAAGGAVVVGPTADEFARLCDKAGLNEAAASAGVSVPEFTVVTSGTDLERLPPFPAYVKAVSSLYDGVPAGRPVRVADRDECLRAVKRWTELGASALVQQEVDGVHWRFHFARGRTMFVQLAAVQLGDYPHRIGQSTVLQFRSMPHPMRAVSERLLETVGYYGAGSIQWIERNGDWIVHDVNLRMPAAVAGTIAAGLDMPRLAVEIALGRETPARASSTRAIRYVWFPGELMALRDALGGGAVGRSKAAIVESLVLGALSPRRQLVPFDLRDPLPTIAGFSEALVRPISRVRA
jgi:carbamoyl-phosphate synthase large subunit